MIDEEIRSKILEDWEQLRAFVERFGIRPIEKVIKSNLDSRRPSRLATRSLEESLVILIGESGARLLITCFEDRDLLDFLKEIAKGPTANTVQEIAYLIATHSQRYFRASVLSKFGRDCVYGYDLAVSRDGDGDIQHLSLKFHKLDADSLVVIPVGMAVHLAKSIASAIGAEIEKFSMAHGERGCDGSERHSIGF